MPPKKLDNNLSRNFEEFTKQVAAAAEVVIFEVFPTKILEINQFIVQADSSSSSPFHLSHSSTGTDVRVHPPPSDDDGEPNSKRRRVGANGDAAANDTTFARLPSVVHANQHLVKVHEFLKKECEELAKNCDKVKLWVNLSMPKIEDGDNFGVQVQEECLNELHRSQESSMNLRDIVRQHHLNRAKIASKLIKYPHIEDYALGLREHDEKQLYTARQNLNDLRNIYAVLFDILNKNIQKLRAPKGNNSSSMY